MGQTLNRPASPSRAGSPEPAGRDRLATGHHACRAALRDVSVSRLARAIILRYVT
jgi:hypothetical protein